MVNFPRKYGRYSEMERPNILASYVAPMKFPCERNSVTLLNVNIHELYMHDVHVHSKVPYAILLTAHFTCRKSSVVSSYKLDRDSNDCEFRK